MKHQWRVARALFIPLVLLGAIGIGCTQPPLPISTSTPPPVSDGSTTHAPVDRSPTVPDKITSTPTIQAAIPTHTPAFIPTLTPTIIGQLAFTSMTFTPAIPSILEAYADGDRVFFIAQDWKSLDSMEMNSISIYSQNLKTGESTLVTTSPYDGNGRLCCMRASENWLTWLTNRSFGDGWRVVAKHLPDGQEMILDRDEDTGVKTLRGPEPNISGDQVVWISPRKSSDGAVKTYLFLFNLSTGEKRTLAEATMPESLVFVDIDGQWVVWSKGNSAGGDQKSNIYLLNLTTSEQTQLSDDDQSHQPVIEGDWIAWRTGFGDTGPIVVYDRRTGERTTLLVKGDFLRMGDGLLLWWTYTSPFSYLYDLQKHIIASFDTKDDFSDTVVYISGRKVAVTSSREPKTLKTSILIRTYLP